MKKILLILFLTLSSLLANIPTEAFINKLVEEIKPVRSGLTSKTLYQIKNPFVYTVSTKGKSTKARVIRSKVQRRHHKTSTFKLYATMNKSAKINNRWVSINKKIASYTLKKITKEYVTLQKGSNKAITVYLNRRNKNIKLLTK